MYITHIAGTGSYLPKRILTNHDLEKMVDTNDAWIRERTGICERRIAAADEVTTDMALIAARKALEAAELTPSDIEMIIFATVSGDTVMPSSACNLQQKLGCRKIVSFDLSAACSGFIYGLTVANQFIRAGKYKNILVVGAEILSRIVNYKDRETCILFGDGAGAIVASRNPNENTGRIYSEHLVADGNLGELFTLPAGGSKMPFSQAVLEQNKQFMEMKGREIFKNAVRTMTECSQRVLQDSGLSVEQVDWLVPHQANLRIIEAVAKYFDFPIEKAVLTVDKTGNTSAATVPIALDTAIRDGRIKRGHNVLLTAFGAGLTSGSVLLRY